jgi:hypothetical protein
LAQRQTAGKIAVKKDSEGSYFEPALAEFFLSVSDQLVNATKLLELQRKGDK